MALTIVLSVGLDPDLLNSRNMVLESAGYTVVAAYSIKEAFDCLQTGDFDLILLCQSIPAKEKDRLTRWIRASGSQIPVVCVSGGSFSGDDAAGVTVDGHPHTLLWGIREVLGIREVRIDAKDAAAPAAKAFDKQGANGAQTKDSPTSANGNGYQTEAMKERFSTLARRGPTNSG